MNVSTVSLNNSSMHNSLLDLGSVSLNPQASLFTPAVRNPDYSAPFMENTCLQRSVESSEENETENMYMENTDEDICSSDLTTCVHDTETASGTENKMEEPPAPPPALIMLLPTQFMNRLNLKVVTDYEYCLLYQLLAM